MDKILGIIGCGNMGLAMLEGIIRSGIYSKNNIIVSSLSKSSVDRAKKEYGIRVTNENRDIARKADIIILAIKPEIYSKVIEEIKDDVKEEVIIVTIAAGIDIKSTEKAFGKDIKIVRTMPNTPAMIGEGMSALSPNKFISKDETKEILELFESFGEAEIVREDLIDAVVGVSGSAPAYVFMFIEAMADAAVLEGMKRTKAYKFAAQSVLGSAKMVIDTEKHPAELKDMVCSPGGTTIEAVAKLEEKGLRDAIISAMRVCVDKSRDMSE